MVKITTVRCSRNDYSNRIMELKYTLLGVGSLKTRPGVLIHDSTIFDGVDERQVARVLELAEKEAGEKGFQYICMMNSDTVSYNELGDTFKKMFNDSIRIRFTDATEDGGLLGIRF